MIGRDGTITASGRVVLVSIDKRYLAMIDRGDLTELTITNDSSNRSKTLHWCIAGQYHSLVVSNAAEAIWESIALERDDVIWVEREREGTKELAWMRWVPGLVDNSGQLFVNKPKAK